VIAQAQQYPPAGMLGPAAIARWSLATQTDAVAVEGLEHVPPTGPALLIAHHYHHLLDGAVLIRHIPRPVHIVVALDWTANPRQRRWMERACGWAHWPVILRATTLDDRSAYEKSELLRYLRAGLRDAAALLNAGRLVTIFPEGYPVIDPTASPRTPQARDASGFLPFADGFRTILTLAHRTYPAPIPLIPIGFAYARKKNRWTITARIGKPLAESTPTTALEETIKALSR
jgi:putative membrane protein